MKTLTLLAPDFSSLDTIWRNALPFTLWPVGSQSLLAHWMDEAVRTGAEQVDIYAADRPAEIRHHIEGGNYWSRKVNVIAIKNDVDAPVDAIRLDRLPAQTAEKSQIDSPSKLLEHWLGLQKFWLVNRASDTVSIDEERMPGGWVGPLARIHPQAKLVPPFWIGTRAEIGADCEIGPNAIVSAGSVLDCNVQIEDAAVLSDTYLGQNTRLNKAVAQGGVLLDVGRACRVDIGESFILAPVSARRQSAAPLEKAGALLLWLLLAPIAQLWPGQAWQRKNNSVNLNENTMPETGRRGPLLIRRWPWLKEIFAGNMHWFGILPRGESDWQHIPPETAERLKSSPRGFFSWADLHGCHDPSAPDEWIHAAYQILQTDETVEQILRRNFFKIAFLNPGSP